LYQGSKTAQSPTKDNQNNDAISPIWGLLIAFSYPLCE